MPSPGERVEQVAGDRRRSRQRYGGDHRGLPHEADPRVVYVNDAFVRQSGFSRADALGKGISTLHGFEDETVLASIKKELAEGRIVRQEIKARRKQGQLLTLDATIVPIADAHNGAAFQGIG